MTKSKKEIIPPDIYTQSYYLTDNEGYLEFKDLENAIHTKFKRVLQIAQIQEGESVLDVGCGRGELIYYALRQGAEHALGIDYSSAAVEIAQETIRRLPADLQPKAEARAGTAEDFPFQRKYDVIFFLEIAEHMHDWQLKKAFQKFDEILTDKGRLIVMTPNYLFEKYLQSVTLTMAIPGNLFKWPLRIMNDKFEPADLKEFLENVFKWRVDRGEMNKKMHCNVMTPSRVRQLLTDFDAKVYCEDHSGNFVSSLTQKWLGREIIAVAKKDKGRT